MDSLLRKCGDALHGLLQSLAHAGASRPADYVMAIQRCVERDRGVEIRAELRAELAQLVEREAIQLRALFQREAHRVADLFMRGAERDALVNQVRGRGHGVEI